MVLSDTTPEALAVQIELMRQASPARRASTARALSRLVIGLSRRAIRKANPGASEREVLLKFAALHYGKALADDVRAYLESNDR